MTVTTKTIADLQLSRFNVRTNETDANATAALEASILARGLLYPLVGHPVAGSKRLGILAGGRRYRAIKALVGRGDLPADWPIDVIVRDVSDAELTELSLAENLIRRELRTYEICAAVAKAHKLGATLQEIAETNGQELMTVRRWLRLGNLAEPIFKSLERGDISAEQASAFAATEDQRLQISAFEHFAQLPDYQRTDKVIRKLLKVGDEEEARLLIFVGEQAYRDAGGAYELDLFAEDAQARGRVGDPGLLRELADAKLTGIRGQLTWRVGKPVRFQPDYPRGQYGVERDLELTPDLGDYADTAAADRAEFLANEIAELDFAIERATDPAADAAHHADRAACAAELAALEQARDIILPDGDIYATLVVDQHGQPETRWWWASHKAKRDAARAAEPPRAVSAGPIAKPAPLGSAAIGAGIGTKYQQEAGAVAKAEHGLTQEGVQIVRAVRREIFRAALTEDGATDIAHDFLIWSLLRHELGNARSAEIGARGFARADEEVPMAMFDAVRHAVENTAAHELWTEVLDVLRKHPSVADRDPTAAFAAFLDETVYWKEWVAAALAGMALTKSANLDGYRLPVHDLLAQRIGLADDEAIRAAWTPTEAFVELLPRDRRLEHATPFLDEATRRNLTKMKAGETIAPVTRALARACWVHPALQFAPATPAEQLEAAE